MKLFFLLSIVSAVCLYLPGYLFARTANANSLAALSLAPLLTISFISVLSIVYGYSGIFASAFSLIIPLISLSALAYLFSLAVVGKKPKENPLSVSTIVLFCGLCFCVAAIAFYISLDGPNSFFQGWDNLHHLASIRTFVRTGNYSSINPDYLYSPNDVRPYGGASSFYPSAWHGLAAMIVSAFGVSIPFAANLVNFLSVALFFPSGVLYLLQALDLQGSRPLIASAVVCLAVPACPWGLLTYGPLFPNLLGISLLPSCLALLINILRSIENENLPKPNHLVLFIVAVPGLVLAHPNTLFSLGVIFAPYLVELAWKLSKKRSRSEKVPALWAAATLLVIALIWKVCYSLPFLEGVVSTNWAAVESPLTALLHGLTLGTYTHKPQYLVSLFVLVGIISLIRQNKNIWMVFSYFIWLMLYVVDAGTDSAVKQFLTGFWYTDYHRIAAMLGLCGIVLACFGIARLGELLHEAIVPIRPESSAKIAHAGVVLIGILLFRPSLQLGDAITLSSPFEAELTEFTNQYNKQLIYYDVMSPLEEDICSNLITECGNNLILNNPQDGSVFAYSVYGANVYYRSCRTPDNSESVDSKILRKNLNLYATNDSVKEAIRRTGARYVLQLDHGEETNEYRIFYGTGETDDWKGIDLVNENTPGFKLVYQSDDIRLYEIEEL